MSPGLASAFSAWGNSDRLGWAFIYIEEAHAEDEWPIGTPAPYRVTKQPNTVEERVRVARRLPKALPCLAEFPLFVDGEDLGFQQVYGAWPARMYLCQGRSLAFKSDASGDAHFDVGQFLERVRQIAL